MILPILILFCAEAIQSSITLPATGTNVFGYVVTVKSSGFGGTNTVNFATTNRTIVFTNGAGYLPGLAAVTVQERLRGGRIGETRTLRVWIEGNEQPAIGSTIPYGHQPRSSALTRQSTRGLVAEVPILPMPPMPGGLEMPGPQPMPLPEAPARGTNEIMRAMRKFYSGQIRARIE